MNRKDTECIPSKAEKSKKLKRNQTNRRLEKRMKGQK